MTQSDPADLSQQPASAANLPTTISLDVPVIDLTGDIPVTISQPLFYDKMPADVIPDDISDIDPYAALNVEVYATEHELRTAYYQLARLQHTDKLQHLQANSNTTASATIDPTLPFHRIKQCYQLLSNYYLRYAYDTYGFIGVRAFKELELDVRYRNEQYVKQQIASKVKAMQQERRDEKQGLIVRSVKVTNAVDVSKLMSAIESRSISGDDVIRDGSASPMQLFDVTTDVIEPQHDVYNDLDSPYSVVSSFDSALSYYYRRLTQLVQCTKSEVSQTLQWQATPTTVVTLSMDITKRKHAVSSEALLSVDYELSPTQSCAAGLTIDKYAALVLSYTKQLSALTALHFTSRYHPKQGLTTHLNLQRMFASSDAKYQASKGSLRLSVPGWNVKRIVKQFAQQTVGLSGSFPIKRLSLNVNASASVDAEDTSLSLKVSKQLPAIGKGRSRWKFSNSVGVTLPHGMQLLPHTYGQRSITSTVSEDDDANGDTAEPVQLITPSAVGLHATSSIAYTISRSHTASLSVSCSASSVNTSVTYSHRYFTLSLPVHVYNKSQINATKATVMLSLPMLVYLTCRLTSLMYAQSQQRVRKQHSLEQRHQQTLSKYRDELNDAGLRLVQLRHTAELVQQQATGTARRVARQEQRVDGLEILFAMYSFDRTEDTTKSSNRSGTSDASDSLFPSHLNVQPVLQSAVSESKLQRAAPLHKLSGFYHPSAESTAGKVEATLYITYRYNKVMYRATLSNNESIELPQTQRHTEVTGKDVERELRRIELYNDAEDLTDTRYSGE